MKGLLIAVCGLDGSGKTTQISLLAEWLSNQNNNYILTKQPTDIYRQDPRVRAYLDHGECPDMESLALLAAADRKWHLKTKIEPSLEQGIHVITDRYLYSSIAFFKARGLEAEYIKQLNDKVLEPDITIYIDVEPAICLERISQRDGKSLKFEERSTNIFNKVRKAFLEEALPKNVLIIDGTMDANIIHQKICLEVESVLKKKEGDLIES